MNQHRGTWKKRGSNWECARRGGLAPWPCIRLDEFILARSGALTFGVLWGVPTDRSHIVARVWRGQDELSNIHLLCPLCHELSELYQGISYWRWLRDQDIFKTVRWGAFKMLRTVRFDANDVVLALALRQCWQKHMYAIFAVESSALSSPNSTSETHDIRFVYGF